MPDERYARMNDAVVRMCDAWNDRLKIFVIVRPCAEEEKIFHTPHISKNI